MKKTVTVEIKACDNCGSDEHVFSSCRKCGKDVCYDCKKLGVATDYCDRVFSGCRDGTYCAECDNELLLSASDPIHNAYVAVRRLAREYEAYQTDFDKRRETAEAHLQQQLKATQEKA